MAIFDKKANVKAVIDQPGWFLEFLKDGVNAESSRELYEKVALFRQCLKLRCDSISDIPYRFVNKDGEEINWRDKFPGSSLNELIWKTEAAFLLTGQAFWEIGKNQFGYTKGLNFVNPYAVNVDYRNGAYYFGVNQQEDGSFGQRLINKPYENKYEMVHFKEYNPQSDVFAGKGDAQVAGVSAALMYQIMHYPKEFLEGGAMPITLLGVKDSNQQEISKLEAWVRSRGMKRGSFWERVLGIEAGVVEPKVLTPPLKDIELTALRDMAWLDIIVAFGVPDSMVRSNAANYATAINDRKSFYEDKLAPRANRFAAVINEQLLEPLGGYHLDFDISQMSLFQEEQEKRIQTWGVLREHKMPIVMASDIAGLDLTDEQRDELEKHVDETPTVSEPPLERRKSAFAEELGKWQRKAEKRVKAGKDAGTFESEIIGSTLMAAIEGALGTVKTVDDVKAVFDMATEWEVYP